MSRFCQQKFLEKKDYESKEQNTGKIGGVSQQSQMLYLNKYYYTVSVHETHRET